jgi:hypothetical protein
VLDLPPCEREAEDPERERQRNGYDGALQRRRSRRRKPDTTESR